jgi:hypothetical protein
MGAPVPRKNALLRVHRRNVREYVRLIVFVFAFFATALAAEAAIRAAWSVPRDSVVPMVLGMAAAFLPVEGWLRWKKKRPLDLTWGDQRPFAAAALLAGGLFLVAVALALIAGWLFWDVLAWSAAMAGAAFVVLAAGGVLAGQLRRRQARELGVPADQHRYKLHRRARRALIALAVIAYGFVLLGFIADLIADIES